MSDEPLSLRLQLASIPAPVLAAWRSRYAAEGGIELNAFALVDKAATALVGLATGLRTTQGFDRIETPETKGNGNAVDTA